MEKSKESASERKARRKGQRRMKEESIKEKDKGKEEACQKRCGVKQGKFAGILNKRFLKSSQPLPEKILYDLKVAKNRLGHFYLCI